MNRPAPRFRRGMPRCRHVLALALIATLGPSCKQASREAAGAAPPRAAKEPRRVQLVKVARVRLADDVTASGSLAAEERVVVSAKQGGRLASIGVDLGSPVKRGEAIAQIETTDYKLRVAQAEAAVAQARALLGLPPSGNARGSARDENKTDAVDVEHASAVAQARATLEEAQKNLERSQTLLDKKLIGRADFDAVQANAARAQSAMSGAREEVYNRQALLRQRQSELLLSRQALLDTTIGSPLDGVVQARHASAGELLAAGAPIATIVRIDPLRLRLEIPDHAASKVAVGQVVRVIIGPGQEHAGKIARLSPAIDEQNRTLTVEAEVPNPGELRPGSFVRAQIEIGSESVLAIPSRAIVVFAGIEKVITVDNGKALETVITTGRRAGDLTEVKTGLDEGREIVLEPGNLQSGDPVELSDSPDRAQVPSRAEAG
jgi:RND family efflux transporter MFP subunit